MKMLAGYTAVLVAGGCFFLVLIMVLVGMVKGLIDSKNHPEPMDPHDSDPNIFSDRIPGLAKTDMTHFEVGSVRPTIAFTIAALLGTLSVLGFSAYGLAQMTQGTKTTAAMRNEAKANAKQQKREQAGEVELGGDEENTHHKAGSTFDIKAK
ncbi:MAG: hypothetical protein J7M25_11670 [Deltaproteobacteria bacterium]|nr:hypothetical protein [Deltaproteobacteria bacterium]